MRKAALLHVRDRQNLQTFKRTGEEEAGVKCSQRIQEPGLALSFEGEDVPRHVMVRLWKNKD